MTYDAWQAGTLTLSDHNAINARATRSITPQAPVDHPRHHPRGRYIKVLDARKCRVHGL